MDNPAGWDGYLFDAESALYTVRFRTYEPVLGRWMERDPYGYADGSNLMEYVRSTPALASDLSGLWSGLHHYQAYNSMKPGGGMPDGGAELMEPSPAQDQIPQCKDEQGRPVELAFDGNTLKGNGFCATTVSGRHSDSSVREIDTVDGQYIETTLTFDYSKARQRQRNVGPMPEGCYFIRTDHEDDASGANNPKREPSGRHTFPKTIAWGAYSWPLTPYPGTDVNDEEGKPRSGMFLHGGDDPGSAGCGDLCNNSDKALHDFMDRLRGANATPCYVKVCARYARNSASVTQTTFYPHYLKCGCSKSPWLPK